MDYGDRGPAKVEYFKLIVSCQEPHVQLLVLQVGKVKRDNERKATITCSSFFHLSSFWTNVFSRCVHWRPGCLDWKLMMKKSAANYIYISESIRAVATGMWARVGRRMAKENQTKELLAMKRSFSLSVACCDCSWTIQRVRQRDRQRNMLMVHHLRGPKRGHSVYTTRADAIAGWLQVSFFAASQARK